MAHLQIGERELQLDVRGQLTAHTEASVWLIDAATYVRMPVTEAPRRRKVTGDGALDDITKIPYRELWLVRSNSGDRLRIVPASRPMGSKGVITGMVIAASPPLARFIVR